MKTASVKEIKQELTAYTQAELLELCMRLIKFKKENKELVTYKVFEAGDEQNYVRSVQEMLDEIFLDVNTSQPYYAKKTLRKIVRTANRYIKYSPEPTSEAEILMHVCQKIQSLGLKLKKNTQILNLYNGLVKRIDKAIQGMHEDLQYDYQRDMEAIRAYGL